MASAGRPVQRRAAILVLEVDVCVPVKEQLGDVVMVLGAGVEQGGASLVCDGIHGCTVFEKIPTDGDMSGRGCYDQRGPPDDVVYIWAYRHF